MKSNSKQDPSQVRPSLRWAWIVIIGCLVALVLITLRPRPHKDGSTSAIANPETSVTQETRRVADRGPNHLSSKRTAPHPKAAEEIVSERVSQFARGHKEIAAAIAKKLKVT